MKKKKSNDSSELIAKGFFSTELKKELKKGLKPFPTRKELKTELSKYATRKELKTELSKYATKKDLKEEIYLLEARVRLMIDNLKIDIVEANKQYRNELLTTIDPILKEILVAREDRTITTHRIAELQEKVANHEERVSQLEHQ